MSLSPYIKEYLEQTADAPRVAELDAVTAREGRSSSRLQRWPGAATCTATDLVIPMSWGKCKARLYRPESYDGEVLPLIIYFHGGGFVICDLDTHDGVARSLSGGSAAAVLSVDYRLAPEHVYPAAHDDAYDSWVWAHEAASELAIDPARVLLCGDSAGANLAIGVARRAQYEHHLPRLCGQVLFYPVTDAPDAGHDSYVEFSEGFGLTAKDMDWFWAHYHSGNGATSGTARQLNAADLAGLPSTIVFTAAYDVLRDEGEAFALRLGQEGVQCTLKRCQGLNHNFLSFAQSVPDAGAVVEQACDWVKGHMKIA